jgi:hypothetical protein
MTCVPLYLGCTFWRVGNSVHGTHSVLLFCRESALKVFVEERVIVGEGSMTYSLGYPVALDIRMLNRCLDETEAVAWSVFRCCQLGC